MLSELSIRLYAIARAQGLTGANAAWLVKAITLNDFTTDKQKELCAKNAARQFRNLPELYKQPFNLAARWYVGTFHN